MEINGAREIKIQNMGWQTDWIVVLDCIRQNDPKLKEMKDNLRLKGTFNILFTKKLIDASGVLTSSGESMLNTILNVGTGTQTGVNPVGEKQLNFLNWVDALHAKLKAKMVELTGNDNALGFGGKILFLPTSEDLASKLQSYSRKYKKRWDRGKIETILMEYVADACRRNDFSPVLHYYIMKDGISQLAAAFDSYESRSQPKILSGITGDRNKIINTKDLFH